MGWDGKHLWHSDGKTNLIYKIEKDTNHIIKQISCRDVRTDLSLDGHHIWQIANTPKTIHILDSNNGNVITEIEINDNSETACGLHVEKDTYWIGFKDIGIIEQRNKCNHKVEKVYKSLPRIAGITKVGESLWYTDYESSLLIQLSLKNGEEKERYLLKGAPTGLTWDGRLFWYSDFANQCIRGVTTKVSS